MTTFSPQYFLGANAPDGFSSLFSELLPVENAHTLYILKGGPGCGKSTLMRRLSHTAQERGVEVEHILCSGDPESLDALILPTLHTALVDGTAPHVVEPRCPGAVDRYVDLGVCYDYPALAPLKEAILSHKGAGQECCHRATRFLKAASELKEDNRSLLLTSALKEKFIRRTRGIIGREFPAIKGAEPGKITHRFLDAVTCQGEIHLYDTARGLCPRIYVLSDSWGLSHELLSYLLTGAAEGGYDAVACHDPLFPDRLTHVLVPQAGVAFLTIPGELSEKPYRHLRLDAMVDEEISRSNRPRLRFSRKMAASLQEEAVSALAQAKSIHDELEGLYRPHADFTQVDEITRKIEDEIFSTIS